MATLEQGTAAWNDTSATSYGWGGWTFHPAVVT